MSGRYGEVVRSTQARFFGTDPVPGAEQRLSPSGASLAQRTGREAEQRDDKPAKWTQRGIRGSGNGVRIYRLARGRAGMGGEDCRSLHRRSAGQGTPSPMEDTTF